MHNLCEMVAFLLFIGMFDNLIKTLRVYYDHIKRKVILGKKDISLDCSS